MLCDLIAASRSFVIEETEYDWNGGTHGHDVNLFVPFEELSKVNINDQKTIAEDICKDLNTLGHGVENEFFSSVFLEENDENNPHFQRAQPFSSRPLRDPASLSIWKPGMVRLFISHRDEYKKEANELAKALEDYGTSSFVAHDRIKPMTEWQAEILKGLETMEIMLAFVTNDFHKSVWTNQEVGYALGRNIPVLSLKLEQSDPKGFISGQQALRGRLDDPAASVLGIYKLLDENLEDNGRLQSGVISTFVKSPNYAETKKRFNHLSEVVDHLSDDEVAQVIDGFAENSQLRDCYYLADNRRLCRFLENTTGKTYSLDGGVITEVGEVE